MILSESDEWCLALEVTRDRAIGHWTLVQFQQKPATGAGLPSPGPDDWPPQLVHFPTGLFFREIAYELIKSLLDRSR
jgi:hypothetical protein